MMMNINFNDIESIDLNLLRVLDLILRERSVTRAAQRLHVTQSAVSNALGRLRTIFNDPLLTRNGGSLAPTRLAQSLAPRLEMALKQLEATVHTYLSFDPETTMRRFTLACTDAHHFHDVPRIADAFARQLPKAGLRIVSPDYLKTSGGLETGDVDAVLMPKPGIGSGECFEELYAEGFAFVVRKDHPKVGKKLTVEQFNALRHIDTLVVQGEGGIGHRMAGDLFTRLGLIRDVAFSVPSFSAAGLAASRSDCLAGIPKSLAGILCQLLPLKEVEAPLPSYAFPMCLVWHPRTEADPACRYFRKVVADSLKDISKPGETAQWVESPEFAPRKSGES